MIGGRDFAISEGYNRSILISTELLGQRTYLFICFGQAPDISGLGITALFLLSVSPKVNRADRCRFFQIFLFLRTLTASDARTTNLFHFLPYLFTPTTALSSLSQGDVDSVCIKQHQCFTLISLRRIQGTIQRVLISLLGATATNFMLSFQKHIGMTEKL